MIKLAKPLDGSDSIEIVTYDNKGAILGNYPDLTAVRQQKAQNSQLRTASRSHRGCCRFGRARKISYRIRPS